MDSDTTALIRVSISHAFLFGFRTIMLICAGLSVASAAVAALMIPTKSEQIALNSVRTGLVTGR
jgi:hypothetical protein